MKISQETLSRLPYKERLDVISAGDKITSLRNDRDDVEKRMLSAGIPPFERDWLVGEFGRLTMQLAFWYGKYGKHEKKF
jgi:hypothetical protein